MKNNMALLVEEMRSWEGFEMIAEKVESLIEKFEVKGDKVYHANASGDGYNVLNHGDFHFNNMVFKKDPAGKLSDVLFVSCKMKLWDTKMTGPIHSSTSK